jgi:prevent-host-death family protein
MHTVSITEAKANWLDIIARVEQGEQTAITRWGQSIAVLHPVSESGVHRTDQTAEPKPA